MRTVGIIRAQPGARATAGRVAALSFAPILAPLIQVRPTGEGPIDLTGVGALAFTSGNGVRALAARSTVRDLPVLAVGAATARAARAAGYANVSSAEGDVAALAQFIGAAPRPGGPILHAGAAEPAGDLAGALTAMGIAALRVDVYETVEAEPGPDVLAKLLGADIVLAHSPRAAGILARVMALNPDRQPAVLCLSHAVAAPLTGLARAGVAVAAAPTEDALMALLTSWRAPS